MDDVRKVVGVGKKKVTVFGKDLAMANSIAAVCARLLYSPNTQ